MSTSISDIPKSRGRPSTGGRKTGIMVRVPDDELAALDGWREQQKPEPSRPEAIRRLIEEGLKNTNAR